MLSCSRTLGLPPHLFMGNEQIFERPAPSNRHGFTWDYKTVHEMFMISPCRYNNVHKLRLMDIYNIWWYMIYVWILYNRYEDSLWWCTALFSMYHLLDSIALSFIRIFATVYFSLVDGFNLYIVCGYGFRAHGTAFIIIHPQCGWEMARAFQVNLICCY